MTASSNLLSNPASFQTPDCILCLRRKLGALGAASFFIKDGTWLLSDYESDSPRDDAEFQASYLVCIGIPQIVSDSPSGLILNDDAAIRSAFPGINALFDGCSLIAACTAFPGLSGVRMAWRKASEPFSEQDLQVLACFGECPPGCGI